MTPLISTTMLSTRWWSAAAASAMAMLANAVRCRRCRGMCSALQEWWVTQPGDQLAPLPFCTVPVLHVDRTFHLGIHTVPALCRGRSGWAWPGKALWILPLTGIVELMTRMSNYDFKIAHLALSLLFVFLGNGELVRRAHKFTCVPSHKLIDGLLKPVPWCLNNSWNCKDGHPK